MAKAALAWRFMLPSFAKLDCITLSLNAKSAEDIDKNGNVTLLDAMLVLNQIVNLTYTVAADVNNDGIVNLLDMLRVLKAIVE